MPGLYAASIINLIAPSLSLLELRGLRDRAVPFAVTVCVSIAGVVCLRPNLTGNEPGAYRGSTQRVFSSVNALWPAVTAVGLPRRHQGAARGVAGGAVRRSRTTHPALRLNADGGRPEA